MMRPNRLAQMGEGIMMPTATLKQAQHIVARRGQEAGDGRVWPSGPEVHRRELVSIALQPRDLESSL
jgi:hypothetical protein